GAGRADRAAPVRGRGRLRAGDRRGGGAKGGEGRRGRVSGGVGGGRGGGGGGRGGGGGGGKDGMRGPTSHDIVDQVRRALATRRVGHLGTLDPFASGLLVVIVGRATRLAPYVAGWAKAYEGVIRLGETTST